MSLMKNTLIIIGRNYMTCKHRTVNIHFMFHIHFRDIKLITFIGLQALLSLEFHQCQIKNKAFKCIHIYHKTCLRFALKALKPIYIFAHTQKNRNWCDGLVICVHTIRGVVTLCVILSLQDRRGVCVTYVNTTIPNFDFPLKNHNCK